MLNYLLKFEVIFLLLNILFLLIILFFYLKKRYPVFNRKFTRFLELKWIKKNSHKEMNKVEDLEKSDILKKEDLTKDDSKNKENSKSSEWNKDLNNNLLNKKNKNKKDKKLKNKKDKFKKIKKEEEKSKLKDNILKEDKKKNKELEKIKELEEKKKQELEESNKLSKDRIKEETEKEKEINRICKQVLIYVNSHELDKAQAACIQWLIIDNKSAKLNLELAKIYELKWDYEKAEFIYKDLINQDKTNPDNYRHLSRILNFQWKQKLSYELLKKCYYYSQDKTDSHLLFDLISLALSQNDFDTVDKFSKEMLKEYPYHKETLLIYAQSSLNKWNTDKAYDLLNKILQLDPYNEQAKQMMLSLSHSKI